MYANEADPEENPTQGWAWNDEEGYFMRPGIFFTNRWSPVSLNLDQQQDSRYQYNPAIHPLYRNVVQTQNDKEQKLFNRDKQRTQENAERLMYWGREDEAQQLISDFNRKYNLGSEPKYSQSAENIRRTPLFTTSVMPQDNTRVTGAVIEELPQTAKKTPQKVRNEALQEEVKNKNPTMSGYFDGSRFVIMQDDGNIIYRQTYPAVAGKPDKDGKFDYSPERQKTPDEGPLPEGTYWINPQKIIKSPDAWSFENVGNIAAGIINTISKEKVGSMPGGRPAWGEGHVQINPTKVVVDGVKRGGFTIHGGSTPGSVGCIDLTENDGNFFDFLEKHRGDQDSIPIFVKYPKLGSGK